MTTAEQNACFTQWIDEHAAVLHHVANGFAEGTDRNDLVQELMLAVWRAVPAFKSTARPSTFIYKVAHNAALTWKRSQRHYQCRIEQYGSLHLPDAESGSAPSDRERETLELVYAAIRQMPPLDRSLILLHLDGVSYAEMANIHGLSESNVGVRLNRLKQKLSESLKEVAHELR